MTIRARNRCTIGMHFYALRCQITSAHARGLVVRQASTGVYLVAASAASLPETSAPSNVEELR